MANNKIRDDQWARIVEFLRDCPGVYVGKEERCRQFVEAVLWIDRTGAQWRELPESRFGKWNSVYKRYGRWADKGIWQRMHEHFASEADLEYLIPDSTVIRAHPCAAGAPKKKGVNRHNHWVEVEVDSAPRFMQLSMAWATHCVLSSRADNAMTSYEQLT